MNGDLYMNLEQNRVFGTVRLKYHLTFHDNMSILKKFYEVNYHKRPHISCNLKGGTTDFGLNGRLSCTESTAQAPFNGGRSK